MSRSFNLKATLVAAALCALPGAYAGAMTTTEYAAALGKCEALVGDDRALCTEAAQEQWTVDARKDNAMGPVARSRGPDYALALQACEPLVGDDRALCTEAAKQKYPPQADANLSQAGAAALQRAADLEAALDKCGPLVGDDRALCTEAAQLRFGKP